jgi:hypothetical protein
MFSVYFIVFIVLYTLLCSIEFVVFNEEILLALCFFSFILFCFNTLSDSVSSSLDQRASKFEAEFLMSFTTKKKSLVNNFQLLFQSHGFYEKFKILLASALVHLNFSKKTTFLKQTSSIFSTSSSKLADFMLLNNKLVAVFQKNCVTKLLYPLIFQAAKTATISFGNNNFMFPTNRKTLKNLAQLSS